MTPEKDFTLLGADNWQSYAYFRAGIRYDAEKDKGAARDMYLKALASNPANIGASLNLALLDVVGGPKDEKGRIKANYPKALELLKEVKQAAARSGSADERSSMITVGYVASYQLAAAYDYQDKKEDAQREADELLKKIRNTIKELKGGGRYWLKPWDYRRQKAEDEVIMLFVSRLKPLAVTMLAAILVRRGQETAAERLLTDLTPSERLHYRVRYNLACLYSRLGEHLGGRRRAAQDKAYKSALDELRYTFERERSFVEYAGTDESLRGVRRSKSSDFDKLTKEYSQPALPQPVDQLYLAGLEIVGETHAKQLKQQGIISRDDLVSKAATPAIRQELAERTGISPDLLQRWALLADMMRVVGTDIPQANLMVTADVDSLKLLKESNPDELAMLLHQVNQSRSLVKQTPEVETVRKWVKEASNTRRMVKLERFIW
jgi:tetratricopeptide (TPR) repeat protein